MIGIFYDDKCPICQSEIAYFYQKYPERITPIAISMAMDELNKAGISQIDALTYLHAKDEQGTLYQAMDAVRLLYKTCDRKWVFLFDLPIIKALSDFIYPIFARHRYKIPKWLIGMVFGKTITCADGSCALPAHKRLK